MGQRQPALYDRHVKPALDAALEDTPVVIVVGPRQCGKSTLAWWAGSERGARKVTLDDAGPRAAAKADPTGFIDAAEVPLVIDEVQKAPELLPAIKSRVDRDRSAGAQTAGMFLLTGSADVWGTLRISESLAGRAERVQLWPLSQAEILGFPQHSFIDRILSGEITDQPQTTVGRAAVSAEIATGGYPEMLLRDNPKRRSRWMESYIEMILERDVRDLAGSVQQLEELPRLLAVAAARVTGLLEVSRLGGAIGMQRDTAGRYLTLLEKLFLLRRVPAWSRNIGQRLIKSPKIWIPDSGLASWLVGFSANRFENEDHPLAGALFENFVASELLKQATWSEAEVRLHHFRTAGGREVDIVVETRDGLVAGIECKLAATVRKEDFRGLEYLRDRLGELFTAGVVVHTGRETLPFGDRLWAVPVSGVWWPPASTLARAWRA